MFFHVCLLVIDSLSFVTIYLPSHSVGLQTTPNSTPLLASLHLHLSLLPRHFPDLRSQPPMQSRFTSSLYRLLAPKDPSSHLSSHTGSSTTAPPVLAGGRRHRPQRLAPPRPRPPGAGWQVPKVSIPWCPTRSARSPESASMSRKLHLTSLAASRLSGPNATPVGRLARRLGLWIRLSTFVGPLRFVGASLGLTHDGSRSYQTQRTEGAVSP